MKLPNSDLAVVPERKLTHYLLNPAHPDNGGKAGFFTQMGFRRSEWQVLAAALQTLAKTTPVSLQTESSHGRKYVMVGRLESPDGKSAMVKMIWIVDTGTDVARLVTAYPHQE